MEEKKDVYTYERRDKKSYLCSHRSEFTNTVRNVHKYLFDGTHIRRQYFLHFYKFSFDFVAHQR